MKIGDTVYVVKHHVKNHKNIGYYIDKCRITDFGCKYGKGYIGRPPYRYIYVDHNLRSLKDIPNKKGKRIYCWNRVHSTLEEAQRECDFKNALIEVRNKYKQDIKNIKEKIKNENVL